MESREGGLDRAAERAGDDAADGVGVLADQTFAQVFGGVVAALGELGVRNGAAVRKERVDALGVTDEVDFAYCLSHGCDGVRARRDVEGRAGSIWGKEIPLGWPRGVFMGECEMR